MSRFAQEGMEGREELGEKRGRTRKGGGAGKGRREK